MNDEIDKVRFQMQENQNRMSVHKEIEIIKEEPLEEE